MTSNSRVLAGVAALAAGIAAARQLWDRDWLQGSTGLTIVATLCVIATDLPDRSRIGKWLAYGLLAAAFVLLGIRLFGR